MENSSKDKKSNNKNQQVSGKGKGINFASEISTILTEIREENKSNDFLKGFMGCGSES